MWIVLAISYVVVGSFMYHVGKTIGSKEALEYAIELTKSIFTSVDDMIDRHEREDDCK